MFSTLEEILEKADLIDDINGNEYSSNPIIGGVVGGEMKSLLYRVPAGSEISPIYAFESKGRRIYRHSLCFLLSYAAYKVAGDRHLVIGHSLGDGF